MPDQIPLISSAEDFEVDELVIVPPKRVRRVKVRVVRQPNAADGKVPPGWIAELWAEELRRKADCCRAEHPETAKRYEGWADRLAPNASTVSFTDPSPYGLPPGCRPPFRAS